MSIALWKELSQLPIKNDFQIFRLIIKLNFLPRTSFTLYAFTPSILMSQSTIYWQSTEGPKGSISTCVNLSLSSIATSSNYSFSWLIWWPARRRSKQSFNLEFQRMIKEWGVELASIQNTSIKLAYCVTRAHSDFLGRLQKGLRVNEFVLECFQDFLSRSNYPLST